MKKVLAMLVVGLSMFGLVNISEAGWRHHHHRHFVGYSGFGYHHGCSCRCCQATKYFYGRKAYGNYCCTRFICGCR